MPKIRLGLIGCMLGMYPDFISKVNHVRSINVEYAIDSIR